MHFDAQHLTSLPFSSLSIFCLGCKTISRRAARRLIVLRPKQNMESGLKWQTCSGTLPSKFSCSTGKGLITCICVGHGLWLHPPRCVSYILFHAQMAAELIIEARKYQRRFLSEKPSSACAVGLIITTAYEVNVNTVHTKRF